MNARQKLIFALAGLGLVIAVPVQAAPNFMDAVIIVAKRDRGDEVRQDQRDTRRDERRDERRDARRDRGDEPREGYGYGYERRQQQRFEEDNRIRGRR